MYDYDVISIGAGSGGCASAIRSADLGKKVALVEYRRKGGTGGTCINRGCIPTKVLVKSAQVLSDIENSVLYGIEVDGINIDMEAIQKKKNSIVRSLAFGLDNFLIKSRKIDRLWGRARFVDQHTLVVDDGSVEQQITAANIVVATGSEPAMIPSFNIDRQNILTSDEALDLTRIPESMLIVGAGALGLEFAHVFSTFGCKVTVAEMMPHVVPALNDTSITGLVEKHLKHSGIDVRTGTRIADIKVIENNKVLCSFENGDYVEAEKALVAIGRSLNTKDLCLMDIGVETSAKGLIMVDEQMRTSVKHIYAVGDIVQGPQLSHKAQKEGLIAAEAIAGLDSKMNYDAIPWVIFMQPEIAAVGITSGDAAELGIEIIRGQMRFMANEKATTMQKTNGLIKIVARKDNRQVIGGQIFGVDASILIQEIALAVDQKLTIDKLADSVHAHPTLSEIVMETAKNALGKSFVK